MSAKNAKNAKNANKEKDIYFTKPLKPDIQAVIPMKADSSDFRDPLKTQKPNIQAVIPAKAGIQRL